MPCAGAEFSVNCFGADATSANRGYIYAMVSISPAYGEIRNYNRRLFAAEWKSFIKSSKSEKEEIGFRITTTGAQNKFYITKDRGQSDASIQGVGKRGTPYQYKNLSTQMNNVETVVITFARSHPSIDDFMKKIASIALPD